MVISLLFSVAVWGAAAVILLRILNNSGIKLGTGKFMSFALCDKSYGGCFEPSKRETVSVFGITFLFRIIVFILSFAVITIFIKEGAGFFDILDEYVKWDANNYIRIATGGYTFYTENGDFTTLAFFPLYPWLMRIVNLVFKDLRISGLILSSVLYSGACCYLYMLFSKDYGRDTAKRAIIYLSIFPHALFFGTLMNESMLLLTSAATLYYIRNHKWALVGIFGAAASLSRMVGILLAVPAAVEWLEECKIFEKLKNKDIKSVWKLFYSKGLWIFLMLAGTGIYLLCNYKTTGDFFKFLEYQEKYWNNGSCYFGTGISKMFGRAVEDTSMTKFAIWIPECVSILFVLITLIYGIRHNRNMYSAFLIVYFIINTGFEWPISVARYMACAIPAFIFLADFSQRHRWTEPIITASMAVGFGIYLCAYLCGHQIM